MTYLLIMEHLSLALQTVPQEKIVCLMTCANRGKTLLSGLPSLSGYSVSKEAPIERASVIVCDYFPISVSYIHSYI